MFVTKILSVSHWQIKKWKMLQCSQFNKECDNAVDLFKTPNIWLNERHIATIVGLIVLSQGIIVFSGGTKNLRDWQSRAQTICIHNFKYCETSRGAHNLIGHILVYPIIIFHNMRLREFRGSGNGFYFLAHPILYRFEYIKVNIIQTMRNLTPLLCYKYQLRMKKVE